MAVAVIAAACTAAQEPVVAPVSSTTVRSTAPSTSGPAPTTTSTAPPTAGGGPTTSATAPLIGLSYTEVGSDLPFPTFLTALPGSTVAYLTTKDGRVWVLEGSRLTPVLDISDRVRNRGEQGLLGMALDPTQPGRFFLHYSATDGDTVLSEFRFDSAGAVDAGAERTLLRLDQPAPNHNGGMIAVTESGMLWLGLGDGGAAGDRFGNGQRPDTLLGAILRLDPDGDPYAIPADNPFADGVGGAPEVWAWGLRNPWRFWIDEAEQYLYIADVGQNAFEEIDVISVDEGGVNFGWPVTEGLHCFSPRSGCDTTGITLPTLEVPHTDAGTCSITGGVVYRGEAIPELEGHYLFSDFCGGYLRSFRRNGEPPRVTDWTDQVGRLDSVVSFGVDGDGEVYVLTADALYRLEPVR